MATKENMSFEIKNDQPAEGHYACCICTVSHSGVVIESMRIIPEFQQHIVGVEAPFCSVV